jgi:hypothetical protein
MKRARVLLLSALLGALLSGQESAPESPAGPVMHYLTIAGLGGEPEYEERFSGWAKDADKTLKGSRARSVVTLFGAAATRQAIREHLAALARQAGPEDGLVIMLIGHGTFDGHDYRFNLPGPDITGAELAALLEPVPARRQLVVNMTSASGAALQQLARKDRVVISATKSGTEKNATVFARYWVEALRDPAADTDHNEAVTALEAYRYAVRKTAAFYETQKRLATEHPLLEDTGEGEGAREPSPENGRGILAANYTIVRFGAAQEAARDPEKQKLYARKEELEQEIDNLKYRKAALPAQDYRKQMRALLLELAATQAELDK